MFRRYYLDNMEHSDTPQLNMQNLRDFNEGLICLTGGYEGPIGRLILQNRKDEAEKKLLRQEFPWRQTSHNQHCSCSLPIGQSVHL